MASQISNPHKPLVSIESDYHQWALDTAEAIRKAQFTGIDWENVAEELASLGKLEERELRSRLSQLMYHLLKQQYQPERKSRSWEISIRNQRRQLKAVLTEQPSLKSEIADPHFWSLAYDDAMGLSANENLPDSVVNQFPQECPFSMEILND